MAKDKAQAAFVVDSVIFDRGPVMRKGKGFVDDHDSGAVTQTPIVAEILVAGSQVYVFLDNGVKQELPRSMCQIRYLPVVEAEPAPVDGPLESAVVMVAK
jgi:hypothetical protein